jgi:very-short-patch-repair endonuclease
LVPVEESEGVTTLPRTVATHGGGGVTGSAPEAGQASADVAAPDDDDVHWWAPIMRSARSSGVQDAGCVDVGRVDRAAKPEIVLRDALNHAVQITKGAENRLIYDRPLPEAGLTWAALVNWWAADVLQEGNLDLAQRHLYQRLTMSLARPPEKLLFRTYADRFVADSGVPALLPQVYLHYDPYVRRYPQERPGSVIRQRMDFLLLLPQRRRVVLEVDGRHHYASSNGQADPHKYATMVAEDRGLRLVGYEVFRFGGAELMHEEPAEALLEDFFTRLLDGSQPEHCRRSLSGTPGETGQTVGLAEWVGTEHDRLAAVVRRGIGGGGAPGASR